MAKGSLRRRFFLGTAFAVVAVMLVSAWFLDRYYQQQLLQTAEQRLQLHVYGLLSVAGVGQGGIQLPAVLQNPDFNQPGSNLWAMVLDGQRRVIWRSISADDDMPVAPLAETAGQWRLGQVEAKGTHSSSYVSLAFQVAWQTRTGMNAYHVVVGESLAVIREDLDDFRKQLLTGMAGLTATLLFFQLLVLVLAYRPIGRLGADIGALEQGQIDRLSDSYPLELIGVTRRFNAVLAKEQEQRERYRASMADLAHSLKTPLTILNGELSQYPDNPAIRNAIARIDSTVEYQLRRAVVSGHQLIGKGTRVDQVVDMIHEAMAKIHAARGVDLNSGIAPELTFHGDENDLMEVLGNLLDNAFKYARNEVWVNGSQTSAGLSLAVEDDGPGIATGDQQRVFQRGERLDSQGLGQGIGLAVVYDIVSSYGGRITADRSEHGGARFDLWFPASIE